MKSAIHLVLTSTVALLGCGKPDNTPDAGVDTSCGLDCASQRRYGLMVNRCFEYGRGADPAIAIGAEVGAVKPLEKIQVIPVTYKEGGIIRMVDSFFFKDGHLYLARREFTGAGTINYRDQAQDIAGVRWFEVGIAPQESFFTDAQAQRGGTTTPVRLTVNAAAASTAERTVPLRTFDNALRLTFTESPSQGGMDTRRVFVEDTGFILFASSLTLNGTQFDEYRLVQIRDIPSPDGGGESCSIVGG